jgi:hypothetical protein
VTGVEELALYINQLHREYWVKYGQTRGVETRVNGNALLTVLTTGQAYFKKRDHRRLKLLETYALLVARLIFSFNEVLVQDFVIVLC